MMKSRYRILYIVGQLDAGGAEHQLFKLAKSLDRAIFEPIVCSLKDGGYYRDKLISAGISVISLEQKFRPDITRAWRVPRVVRQFNPSIIHTYLFTANTWGRLSGLIYRIPTITTERSANMNKPFWITSINRLLSKTTQLCIANSYAGSARLINSKELPRSKVKVIHNGIDLLEFNCIRETQVAALPLDINKKDKTLIGFIGRLDHIKDPYTFINAIRLLAERTQNFIVLCAGKGPLEKDIKKLVSDLDLKDFIIFLGFREDIPSIMKFIDILCISSICEGIPNVVCEAMAASKPVVATNVGGIDEIIQNNNTGLLVPPKDPKALCEALYSLITNPNEQLRMGINGRNRIEVDFSLKAMVASTENIYKEIIALTS